MVALPCSDILRKCANASFLDAALFLALVAGLLSWLDPSTHGSVANNSLISAGHWVLVFLLASARVNADYVLKTDVEVTWLLYGFMLGEIDSDSAASVTLMLISAVLFQRHRRQQRLKNDDDVRELPELPSEEGTAAF